MGERKRREWKIRHRNAGVEYGRLENHHHLLARKGKAAWKRPKFLKVSHVYISQAAQRALTAISYGIQSLTRKGAGVRKVITDAVSFCSRTIQQVFRNANFHKFSAEQR